MSSLVTGLTWLEPDLGEVGEVGGDRGTDGCRIGVIIRRKKDA